MKAKENMLRTIRHDSPQWVPNGMEAIVTIGAPVVERPERAGKDAFGVVWAYEEGAQGGYFPSLWRASYYGSARLARTADLA